MKRINELFLNKKGNILNIFFTAGYPELDSTVEIIKTLDTCGVDMIEVGMPYSDPLADGPVIQGSSQAALKNGMTLDILFEQIKEARKATNIPLILMGYYNQIMQYGQYEFLSAAKSAGIDGLILPDLPLAVYKSELQHMFEKLDLGIIFLICPHTSEERIREIDKHTRGFTYIVSSNSITGRNQDVSEQQQQYFERLQSLDLKSPKLIGFGIHNNATFENACKHAQGAIIGSAFIKALANKNTIEQNVETFISSILKNN